jgi:hypothetical protein
MHEGNSDGEKWKEKAGVQGRCQLFLVLILPGETVVLLSPVYLLLLSCC